MKIAKYEHACFVVEQDNESLIIDPGKWTTNLVIPKNVVGLIITHDHQDHMNREIIQKIIEINPTATIVAHENIVSGLQEFSTKPVVPNEEIAISNFNLEFFGGNHAIIQSDMPLITNLGVLINKSLYYSGDSFAVPDKNVDILALPIAAPWLKFSEMTDFLTAIHPKIAFPTHDAILSDAGKQLLDSMVSLVASKTDITYLRIDKHPLEA